jgi:hypothetical protein
MKDQLIRPLLFIYVALTLIGTALKIMHIGGANLIFPLIFLVGLILTVNALGEIFRNKDLRFGEKGMWLIGFLVLHPIAIVLYYFLRRNQLSRERKTIRF